MKKNKLNKLAIGFLIASMMVPGPAAAFAAETRSTELESQAQSEAEEAAEKAAQEAAEREAQEAAEREAQEAAERAAQEAAEKAAQEEAEKAAREAAEKAAREEAEKAAQEAAEKAAQEEAEKNKEKEAAEKAAAESEEKKAEQAKEETASESKQQKSQETAQTEKETEADKNDDADDQEETAAEHEAETEEVSEEPEEEADAKADVEKEADWKKTLPEKLAHKKDNPAEADYRADIVAIAKSQVDYEESIRNFVKYKDGSKAQYSRYGAWFGENYADPWDAEFACFVLYYAGVPDVPYDGDTAKWTHKLAKEEMFLAADYEAEAGDLIFLQEKDGPFHVGIVTKVGAKKLTVIAGTVGETVDSVKSFDINKDDSRIYAYGVVVPKDAEVKAEEETAEKEVTEKETAGKEIVDEEAAVRETEKKEPTLTKQKVDVSVYTDAKKEKKLEGVSITLEGEIPEKATVSAYPVNFSPEGEEMYAAYQIIILDENGKEFHQKAGEGKKLALTIIDPELYKVFEEKESIHCWHKDGETIKDTSYKVLDNGSVVLYSDEI